MRSPFPRVLLLPLWTVQLVTQAKSFTKNPLIGSRLLNRCGLHVARIVVAHGIMRARMALLGIPSPATLGMLAGLLSFIPNLGPILSLVPALLAALTVSLDSVLYVTLLYLAVQTVESYLITPLIQQRAVALPPALLFSMQLALGAAFGLLGLLFATPLTVAALVAIRMLWVEDRLGREPAALV